MLLGTLGVSLLGNLLTGGKEIVRAGEGVIRAGQGAKKNLPKTIRKGAYVINLDEYENMGTH